MKFKRKPHNNRRVEHLKKKNLAWDEDLEKNLLISPKIADESLSPLFLYNSL